MNTNIDEKKVREFLNAFEEVFDRDWSYTKEMLGIREETQQQKQEAAKLGFGRAVLPETTRNDAPDVGLRLEQLGGLTSLVAEIAANGKGKAPARAIESRWVS